MSMAVGDKKGGAIADINVTPMADIMIVLLIIFMVITPMLQKGVDVKLPVAANTEERKDEQKSITVAVQNDATFTTFLNGIKYENRADLVPQLRERLAGHRRGRQDHLPQGRQRPGLLRGHEGHGPLREAGVEQIALIAEAAGRGELGPWPTTPSPRPRKRPAATASGSCTRTTPRVPPHPERCPTSTSRRSST